jgi:hypothetical protein
MILDGKWASLCWCIPYSLANAHPNALWHELIVLCLYTSALELSFMFLLVWYYCTLTIRESILKVNGSRIKGWWRLHHFISTVVSGVLLIWPNTGAWYEFRDQFMWFNVYISKYIIVVIMTILRNKVIIFALNAVRTWNLAYWNLFISFLILLSPS